MVGEDPNCVDEDGNVLDDDAMEDIISNYVTLQCGIRKLSPHSVSGTYLPGIASTFDKWRSKCKTKFRIAIRSKEVKLTVDGFKRQYDKKNPKATRVKTPYGMDLAFKSIAVMKAMGAFNRFGVEGARIMRKRVYAAETTGTNFLLRQSEYLQSGQGTATTATKRHMTFFDYNNKPIPYNRVGEVKAKRLTFNAPFAKTDASGYGRRTSHIRQDGNDKVCPVCIMEDYIMDARDNFGATESSGLFDIPNYGTLTVGVLQQVMQWTVDSVMPLGMKKRVTSHSLRYGGATMMAAAGYPHYIIAIYGGWSPDSKALRIYTKPSEQMIESVSAHMVKMAQSDVSTFFINDAIVIEKGR